MTGSHFKGIEYFLLYVTYLAFANLTFNTKL
jgi:hypothetical protein